MTSRAAPDLLEELEIVDCGQLFANPNVQLSESLVRGIKLQAPFDQNVPNSWLTGVRFVDCDLANICRSMR